MDTHESRLEGPSEWVWIEVAHEEVDSGGAIKSKATMISELAKWLCVAVVAMGFF